MKQKKLSIILVCLLTFMLMLFNAFALSPVDLGTAENFVVLSKSGISTTGTTSIVGDIGVSPIGSTAITGFGLILDSSNEFSKSSLITGNVYASDYSPPTPIVMTTAISDMETAYTDAAGRTLPDFTELGAGDVGGMTLTPGLYKWGTGLTIPTDVTISGSSSDVWIFQIAQDLDVSNGKQVILSGGALPENIFWQVGGQTTLGTTADFSGIILSQTAIIFGTGATLDGRALAQTAVVLDSNMISLYITETSNNNDDTTNDENIDDSSNNNNDNNNINDEDSTYWDCSAEWTVCNSEGISTQICTKPNTPSMIKKQSCIPPEKVEDEDNTNVDEEIENENKINNNYIDFSGNIFELREVAKNLKELKINEHQTQSNVKLRTQTNLEGETQVVAKLNNGLDSEIKIMPDTASEIALEKLKMTICTTDNNCTIELRSVGNGDNERNQYEIQMYRDSKILGIFPKKMQIEVIVDAQTGDTRINKPWWAFIASESQK